ncbi:MAG: hypothetical protein V2I76_07430, partial [Roseobacter sp.]|nr:hypothetical protein [Roseobacter sp.]
MTRPLLGISLWIPLYLGNLLLSLTYRKPDFCLFYVEVAENDIHNPLFLNGKEERCKKNDVWRKKGLRVPVTNRRTPLTGGAEMHQRGARRAGRSGNATDRNEAEHKKSEVNEAGRARKLGRITVNFVSTLFEIDEYLKRYVGGLVHSMD